MMRDEDMRKKGLREAGKDMMISISVGKASPSSDKLAQMVSPETSQGRSILGSEELAPRVKPDGSLETPEERRAREEEEMHKNKMRFIPDEPEEA